MSLLVRASNLQQSRLAVPRAQRRGVTTLRAAENNSVSTSGNAEPTIFFAGQALKESEWNTAVKSGTITPPAASSSPAAAAAAAPSLVDVMAFGGAAPEITNGRLAMLGFVSAVAAELSSGESVLRQFSEEPTGIVAAFVIFMAASLVPLVQNGAREQSLGPFTPNAELINGRAAMLGFASLLIIEAVKGSPLF